MSSLRFALFALLLPLMLCKTSYADVPLLSKPVEFSLPFAPPSDNDRGYVDVPIQNADALSNANVFALEFECSEPDAIGSISFYFRSGNGWYHYNPSAEPLPLNPKHFRLEIQRSPRVTTEGKPEPFEKSDLIRFAIWRGDSRNAAVKLLKIEAGVSTPERLRYAKVVKRWQSILNVGDPRKRSIEERSAAAKEIQAELKNNGFDLPAAFFDRNADEETLRSIASRWDELEKCLDAIHQKAIRQYCAAVPSKTPEFRAWWEHAGLGAYPGDWDRTMKELSDNGFNAVISNLLWGGSAHYASDVIPRSRNFGRYGDQVEQAIAAGKKYGVAVHAWQVCWWLNGSPQEYIDEMRRAGRTQVSFDGEPSAWLCPSHPKNIDLECETLCELVRKYKDLAGIHYDYIRYPDGEHCFCAGCRERFEAAIGEKVENFPQSVRSGVLRRKWDEWRCGNITQLVERVHREAKAIRPNIQISAAVFTGYPGTKRSIAQDWGLWVERGYLDFICPMDYTDSPANFEGMIKRQQEVVRGRIPLYPGIGATATGIAMTPDRVAAEIDVLRRLDASGFVIFNLTERTIQTIPPMLKLGATREK